DLRAGPRDAAIGRRPSVGDGIVIVVAPLPDLAGEIVVTERPAAGRVRAHVVGGAGVELATEGGALRRRRIVAPRVTARVVAAHRALVLGFARQALAGPRAVSLGVVPAHFGDGLRGPL